MTEGDGFRRLGLSQERQRFNETARSIFQAFLLEKENGSFPRGTEGSNRFPSATGSLSAVTLGTAGEKTPHFRDRLRVDGDVRRTGWPKSAAPRVSEGPVIATYRTDAGIVEHNLIVVLANDAEQLQDVR